MEAPRESALSRIRRSVGVRSRIAGLGLVALTLVFLLLALVTQSVVFEVDSVLTLLGAVVLLLSDPHRRIQARVVDALVGTSEEMTAQLLSKEDGGVRFVYLGKTVPGISMSRAEGDPRTKRRYIPPGRGLANLFIRESGLKEVTMESLTAMLPSIVTESFGFAVSMTMVNEGDSITFVLGQPSFSSICGGPPSIGCPLASCLAILVSAATQRTVSLESCSRNEAEDTATIVMKMLPFPEKAV